MLKHLACKIYVVDFIVERKNNIMEEQKLNLVDISFNEKVSINGGSMISPTWTRAIKGGLWGVVAAAIIENWTDIKQGCIDGWNDAMND
jgi:hypothetical protein